MEKDLRALATLVRATSRFGASQRSAKLFPQVSFFKVLFYLIFQFNFVYQKSRSTSKVVDERSKVERMVSRFFELFFQKCLLYLFLSPKLAKSTSTGTSSAKTALKR